MKKLCLFLSLMLITASASAREIIIDQTQSDHNTVISTNTQTATSGKPFPKSTANPNPYAAIKSNNVLDYVRVIFYNSDLKNDSLAAPTANTTKGNTNTYIHRRGTVDMVSKAVTPLPGEELTDYFTDNGQAFDLDRLRYAANKLWAKWKSDVTNNTGWFTKFGYQPTGTMSFEQFIDNIDNHRPMYGLIRVMLPLDSRIRSSSTYRTNCVNGNEFDNANRNTCESWSSDKDYNQQRVYFHYSSEGSDTQRSDLYAKTIEVYGTIIYDFIQPDTYEPSDFSDDDQDYADNSNAGRSNRLLPRSESRNAYISVMENVLVNPTTDRKTQTLYSQTPASSDTRDYQMDTLSYIRDKYILPDSDDFEVSEIPDSSIFEYWMREAAAMTDDTARDVIISHMEYYYDLIEEEFTTQNGNTSSYKTEYAGSSVWGDMEEPDQFHAYFPSGYERGWLTAFDALDLTADDWKTMPVKDTNFVKFPAKSGGKTDYPEFSVPDESITIDAFDGTIPYRQATEKDLDDNDVIVTDTDPSPNALPNVYLQTWEDFPAMIYAGGVLDMHHNANISGMVYSPDSIEIEAWDEGRRNRTIRKYINGALLFGNGIVLSVKTSSASNSLTAISFNFHSFDNLRGSSAVVGIRSVSNIRDIQGQ